MNQETMMKTLSEKFNLETNDREYFDGGKGLHVLGNICKPETGYLRAAEGTMQENALNSFLRVNGWFSEAYDSETIMLINDNI